MKRTRWFKDGVFYQIWPRSFKDGNGDGMGDLIGVYEKLDYIKSLGVDGIWFSPLYPSPGADCGYDISDYMNIAPEFGGMEAFRKVLDGAHERGMKVIMDLVVNHTSDEHEWFQKSRRRIDPYTDYYIWRPKRDDGKLPNNWDSMFEGKAWQWDEVRQEYYLHLFAIKQPDLNMDNPLVRQEVVKILRFWLDMGVDGFREDVITFISKPEKLPDARIPAMRGILHYNHGPHLHEYLQQFRREAFDDYDCVTIAESALITPEKALEYITESDDNELDMVIQFECMCADCLFTDFVPLPFSLRRLKNAFSSWQEKLEGKAWNMLYLENHDHPRIISRYGSEQFRIASGKMLCAMYMFQKGTPFIYQGQEIGMINWYPESVDQYEDVQTVNHCPHWPEDRRLRLYHRASRDNARTPVQWDSSFNAGFTTATPWFYVNQNYTEINVETAEADPNSILHFYRKAICLRKELSAVRHGKYHEYCRSSGSFFVYAMEETNQKVLVICSFSSKVKNFRAPKEYDLRKGRMILGNYGSRLNENGYMSMPYEVRVYLFE
ncbi:MAG: alpha-glucosidase [Oscillospiraceae bacterium]|nr:alpha-glucosidase [Oscillospiraceae bacterium]